MARPPGIQVDSAKLRALLQARGLTASGFAKRGCPGVSARTLCAMVAARPGRFAIESVYAVASHLGVQAKDILPGSRSARGSLETPKAGASVGRAIQVSGNVDGVPLGDRVFIVVQRGRELWPKEPELDPSKRSFSVHVMESGEHAPYDFDLLLVHVSPAGGTAIDEWLARGRAGHGYPGLAGVDGLVTLACLSPLRLS